jgi:protein-S-isoprenylcysteine O-methyltransferase Ste14
MQLLPGMELFPVVQVGWLNGWVLLAILWAVEGVLVLYFPKGSRGRLFEYDHSRWSRRHRVYLIVGKSLALVCIVLFVFTPLKVGTAAFALGVALYLTGLIGFAAALLSFRNTPADQPVIRGIYRVSRNPQVLTLFVTTLGIALAVGSWSALGVLILSAVFGRGRVLEEEKACLDRYGEAYRAYIKRVPRYLLIKTHLREDQKPN